MRHPFLGMTASALLFGVILGLPQTVFAGAINGTVTFNPGVNAFYTQSPGTNSTGVFSNTASLQNINTPPNGGGLNVTGGTFSYTSAIGDLSLGRPVTISFTADRAFSFTTGQFRNTASLTMTVNDPANLAISYHISSNWQQFPALDAGLMGGTTSTSGTVSPPSATGPFFAASGGETGAGSHTLELMGSLSFTPTAAGQTVSFTFSNSIDATTEAAAPVPELDPGSLGSALLVLMGGLALLERRGRRCLVG
jgi:hypothetical protein